MDDCVCLCNSFVGAERETIHPTRINIDFVLTVFSRNTLNVGAVQQRVLLATVQNGTSMPVLSPAEMTNQSWPDHAEMRQN
jgi:hypothetical protein